jgi:TP901 family phage tail tape measure protein
VARDDVVVVVTAETRGFGAKMAGAEKSVKGIDKAAGQAAKGGLGMMSSSMMRLGAAAAPVMALGLAFKSSVQEFAAFQTQAFQVGNITASTTAEITKFSHEILQLPAELGNSTEMMKGMYQAISAGIPEKNALTFITENAKAAKGNLADMSTTVKGSAAIMNAYNLDVNKTTDVLDAMVRTVDLGVLNFAELSTNIGKGMSVAKAAGIGYEELLASLAALTRGGMSVEAAMTAIRGVSVQLLKPQEKAIKTARALGIEFNRAAIESQGFVNWLGDLAGKVGDSETAIAALFGDVEGLNGALQFTSESGGQMLVDILDQMQDRAGRTEENFARVTGSLGAKWDTLVSNVSKSAIQFGGTWAPIMSDMLDGLNMLIEGWTEFGDMMARVSRQQVYALDTDPAEAALASLAASFRDVAQLRDAMASEGYAAGELISGPDITGYRGITDSEGNLRVERDMVIVLQDRLQTLMQLHAAQQEGRDLTADEQQTMEQYAPALEKMNEILNRQAEVRGVAADAAKAAADVVTAAAGEEQAAVRKTGEEVDRQLEAYKAASKAKEAEAKRAAKASAALRKQEQAAVLKDVDELLKKSAGIFSAMSAQLYDTTQMGIKSDLVVEQFGIMTTELSDEWKQFTEDSGVDSHEFMVGVSSDFIEMQGGLTTGLDEIGLKWKGTGDESRDAWAMSMSDILADGTYVFGGLQKLAGEAADEISKEAKEMARAVETMAGGITSGMTGAMDDFFTATLTGRFDEYGGILNTLFEDMGATAGATLSDAIMGSLFGEGGMQEWMQAELAKLPIFGGEGGAFADMTGGQRAMGMAAGAGMIYGATQQQSRGAGAMQGAMGGAMAGASFGPVGMIVGAILGGAAGYLGSGVDTPTTQLSIGAYGLGGGYTGNLQARHQGYKPEMAQVYLQQLFATYSEEKLEWINALREFGDAALFEQMGELPRFDSDVLKMPADAMAAYFTETWLPSAMQNWAWPAMQEAMGERFVTELGQQRISQLLATLPDEQRMGALTDIIGVVQGMGELFEELDWDEAMMPSLDMGIMENFRAAQDEMSNQFEVIRASWEHMNLIEIAQDWEMLESTIYDARQTELDMVRQIRQLTDDIVLSINQQIESLELGGMGEAEQRAYLEQRIADLYGQLVGATDPNQVAQLTSDIQQYASMLAQAYGEQLYTGSDNVFLEMMQRMGASMGGLTGAGGGLAPGTSYADIIQAALEATRDAAVIVNQGFEDEIHDANEALINELRMLADEFGIFRGQLSNQSDWIQAEAQEREEERFRDPREAGPRGGLSKPDEEIDDWLGNFTTGVEAAADSIGSLTAAIGSTGGGGKALGGGLADSIVLTDQRLIALATSTQRATQAMDSLATMIGQIGAGGGQGKTVMPPPTRRTTTYTTALR